MALSAPVEISTEARLRARATRLIFGIGLAMAVAVAVLSGVELVVLAQRAAFGGPKTIVWTAAACLLLIAAWAAVKWNRGPLRTHPLATVLAVIIVTRLLDIALVSAPLESDFLTYYNLGAQIAQTGPLLDRVPTGYPTALAVVFAPFGAQPVYGQLLNCVMALVTAALLYDIALRIWGADSARWAAWLFALAPSQILMTGVLASEPAYGLLLTLAIWISVRLGPRRILAGLAIGAVLAASNYVRPTSPALVPAFVVLLFLVARFRVATLASVAMVGCFLVLLLPVAVWSDQTKGELSISPSNYGGWSLLVGTDSAHTGQFDPDLASQVEGVLGTPEFDRRAGQLAIDRLRKNPAKFVPLAIEKFPIMWAADTYGVLYTLGIGQDSDHPSESKGLLVVSGAGYLAIVAFAAYGLWAMRSAVPPTATLILLLMLALAVVHTFLEIEPRYHSFMVPLFCILGGYGVSAFGSVAPASRFAAWRLRTRRRTGPDSAAAE